MHHSAPFIAPLSGVTYKKFLQQQLTSDKFSLILHQIIDMQL